MAKGKHIILVGFMGAGKSTVARKLARRMGMMSLDTDIFISRETGMSCQELVAAEGEKAFRARERDVLSRLADFDPCIISCGGGTVLDPESRRIIQTLGTVVYFKVDPQEAVSRISRPETRPLLSQGKSPEELLAEREVFYREVADITIETSGRTSSSIAYQLAETLKGREG